MKKVIKFFVIVFAIITLLATLSVAIMIGTELGRREKKTDPYEISNNELTITLTKEFEYDFYYRGYGNEIMYISDKHIVGLYHTTIEEVTKPGGPPTPLRTYASLFYPVWVGLKGVEAIELQEKDGLLYSEIDMNADGNPDDICFFFETEKSFYFVHMKCNKQASTYEESRDQFFAWAKTVRFSDGEQGE
jgi:hypothetical protein